jgi:hypothetical protein
MEAMRVEVSSNSSYMLVLWAIGILFESREPNGMNRNRFLRNILSIFKFKNLIKNNGMLEENVHSLINISSIKCEEYEMEVKYQFYLYYEKRQTEDE